MPHSFRLLLTLVAALLVAACTLPPVRSADPAPQPSDTALRLIGNDPVSFPAAEGAVPAATLKNSLGTTDFTVGLSVLADDKTGQDLGDLISQWDPVRRHGFTLNLRNNTGSTSSQSNWRQLQFGVDAGTEPTWVDEGRPGAAILGFALCVHQGELYAGTCEPGAGQAGLVYRYRGPGQWEALGPLDGSNSVTALASFGGELYAGTGKYRLAGSSLKESENATLGGKIYRLATGGRWELVGDLAPTEAIAGLVNFRGRLYASSLYRPAGFYRYEGGNQWTALETPGGRRVESLGVQDGSIYASSYDSGAVYRYDGEKWEDLGLAGADNTQTYSFATWQDRLHVGTWPSGKVYRLGPDRQWVDAGRLGEEQEVMGVLIHNGVFYAGSLPKGEVYRYAGGTQWDLLKQIDTTPDVRFRRVWTMATFQGRLFATTLPSGKVWSMSAGNCVTDDHELPAGWHDIVAQRKDGKLRLFVDGQLKVEAAANPLALETAGLPLHIGNGPRGHFHGQLKQVWLDVNP